ncbi:MAG TPA: C45 family peptidase [Roseiflexaceae bacterium]|jgi:isopenicillin-N N-acyltransferase-like protein|nr:C45 family peptidase [Roseiflexaceae bacterium]
MFPIITLSGSAYERGCQYGQQAIPQIRHSIASYARLFAYRKGAAWAAMQQAAEAYLPVLREYAPDVLEEMRGIADGAGVALLEIVALNARTELISGSSREVMHPAYYDTLATNQAAGVPDHGECTTVAALPETTVRRETLLAQTWDWNGDQREACVILRYQRPDLPDAITVTEGGIVAKIGLNTAGVGVCLNILASLADGAEPGMPVHVLLRQLLDVRSVEEGIALAHRARAGASSCVTVADKAGHAVSMEVTPSNVGLLYPHDGLLVHTNHCVVDGTRAGERPPIATSSTQPRFDRATELLHAERQNITTATLIDVLRDREGDDMAICRLPNLGLHPADRVESVLGVVMELDRGVMHIAPNVPCKAEFEPVRV